MRDVSGFWMFVVITGWIAGAVLAKGFWSTAFAVLLPPWAWYLVVEKVLLAMGVTA